MILARLTRAMRQQNWFAVALEFVIVVAGVVIGFQVTAWNAEREAVALERSYLERLHEDMIQSANVLEGEIENSRRWHENGRATLNALLSGQPEAAVGDGRDLNAATRLVVGSPQRATLNELINRGQMTLIRDTHLRREIAETHARLQMLSEYMGLMSNIQPPFTYAIQSRLQTGTESIQDIEYDFEALAGDQEFLNALGHMLRLSATNANWLNSMLEEVNALEDILAETLGLPSTNDAAEHESSEESAP